MRRLVRRAVVGRGPVGLRERSGAHRLDNLGELVGQVAVLLGFVVLDVDRHPHQRSAEAILVEGIEVEIDVTVRIEAAVHSCARLHGAQIIVPDRSLPGRAPLRRAGRRQRAFYWTGPRLHLADVPAADEAERAMVEVVAVELVDAHADRAGGDERVEVELALVEEAVHGRYRLMSEVASDPALAGLG